MPDAALANAPADGASPTASLDPNAGGFGEGATGSAAPDKPVSPVSSASWTRDWFKEDGALNHKAFEKAPDDLKAASKQFERYKTQEDLIRGHLALESAVGKKGFISPPKADAPAAEMQAYKTHLRAIAGAPDKPEGYGLARPEKFPEKFWDQGYANEVSTIMFEEGASPALAQRLSAAALKNVEGGLQRQQAQEAQWWESQDALVRQAFVKEGLDYPKGLDLATRAGAKFGIDPQNPVFKNASVMAALARIGKAMGEDRLVTGSGEGVGLASMTAQEADKEATAMLSDKNHPDYKAMHDKGNPRHDEVVKTYEALMKRAYAK